jgi:hypothetical protein
MIRIIEPMLGAYIRQSSAKIACEWGRPSENARNLQLTVQMRNKSLFEKAGNCNTWEYSVLTTESNMEHVDSTGSTKSSRPQSS